MSNDDLSKMSLFDFADPNLLLRRQTQQSVRRQSGTVPESVKHGVVHTWSPDATIHHTVVAACPYPVKARADAGEFYMVAYVSIPTNWLNLISSAVGETYDISFIGPAGTIQKLPPVLMDMEELLGNRVYIGFDWLWIGPDTRIQPSADKLKDRLTQFVSDLRTIAQKVGK